MCVCVIVISFGWYQNEPESTCHCPRMLLMVLPMRKEEGRRGDRVQGSMPVLTCLQVSAVDSGREKPHSVFVGKLAPHLALPDPNDLWPFSHSFLVCTYIYSVRNSSYLEFGN